MKIINPIRRLIGYLTGTQYVDRVVRTGEAQGPVQISTLEDPDLWESEYPIDNKPVRDDVLKKILISEVNGVFEASGGFKDYVRFVRF